MEIKISKDIVMAIGKPLMKPYVNFEDSNWEWRKFAIINLAIMSEKSIIKLRTILKEKEKVRGVITLIKDIDTWRVALSDSSSVKPRSVQQFSSLLKKYLESITGHRIYKRNDDEGQAWLSYYVNEVTYHPAVTRDHCYIPASVVMEIFYEEFGGKKEINVRFYERNCCGMSVIESLARMGYIAETPEARKRYLEEIKRFGSIIPLIGKQYLSMGAGTDDLDGNPGKDDDHWYWNKTHTIQLVREGQPTRVVVDVFYENDKTDRDESEVQINHHFWEKAFSPSDEADNAEDGDDEEDSGTEEPGEVQVEIPVHPFCAVFDLSKHLRLRVHVNYLTEYAYDSNLADKLILPAEQKALVKILIEHKDGGFKDIVKGKGGGANVLLCGPPGTGKTLTAEIYAESEGRALYSVQCSQLGTDPNALEGELLKVFARAKRWNAVMLLDEADVYVHERGQNMEQNAIVGVFLRVLEYQNSVLFLTTNRPEDVDDAIASRCIAKLTYKPPSGSDQRKIWKVLSSTSKINLPDDVIASIERKNPGLTGRDVKNLLKLAALVAAADEKPITSETVEFVKQFKPTTLKEDPHGTS